MENPGNKNAKQNREDSPKGTEKTGKVSALWRII